MKNLRELFTLYPLGCESFGAEWLRRWEALGKLLRAPAYVEALIGKNWLKLDAMGPGKVEWCIRYIASVSPLDMKTYGKPMRRRVVLLDGTIVREWGQQNERQATLYIRGRYPAWRIDARGTVSQMLERGEKRSQAKGLVMYRYAVKVVDNNGVIVKQWEKNRP